MAPSKQNQRMRANGSRGAVFISSIQLRSCAVSGGVSAALTRPEGVAFWVLGAGVVVSAGSSGKRRRLVWYAAPGFVLLIHLVWRIVYYGVPLPNTYYAKMGGATAAAPARPAGCGC